MNSDGSLNCGTMYRDTGCICICKEILNSVHRSESAYNVLVLRVAVKLMVLAGTDTGDWTLYVSVLLWFLSKSTNCPSGRNIVCGVM